MSEQPVADIRVGASPDALAPISVAERPVGAGAVQWFALGMIVSGALVADQLTKWLVRDQLLVGERWDVLGPLDIHHVTNTGIAFGLFGTATTVVIFVTAAVVAWLAFVFARSGRRHPVLPAALGLIIGGSLGNLLDRVRIGHVTDYLDLGFWPAFNLADAFIVIGVIMLAWTMTSSSPPGLSPVDPRRLFRS